ncbi:MAG: 2-hydroxyglutaryl-CoA dehydratase [Firmicutes bacterium]|nr:2-hydroxyglutaryl-CoA dehydratase [Bacillota bacterium]
MPITAGIDVGSLSAEAVVYSPERGIITYSIVPTGANSRRAAERALSEALAKNGNSLKFGDLDYIVATGYGRISVDFANKAVTEITCHAKGASFLRPGVKTVIDIGGQDSKVITLDGRGKVTDFVMNDKCAAGTGRFLEVMASALEVNLTDLASLSRKAAESVPISSMCTVFAESEVVSLIAEGTPPENIIRGLHDSIAKRVAGMAGRLNIGEPFAMTGGVAKNAGVVDSLKKILKADIFVPPEPQIAGALGAALLASEMIQ